VEIPVWVFNAPDRPEFDRTQLRLFFLNNISAIPGRPIISKSVEWIFAKFSGLVELWL